ncbi:CD59 protein [Fasciola hepatica]|uniref:CD59 protein n=1 Tax=Fasciola hepatica TaxID=6192 RepID=A0A4E0RYP4_FASHE|nr:CD59 protein [Fasciola hepatica]
MFRIVAVLVAFSFCFWEGNAAKCYSCTGCTIPFDANSVTTQDNCASCMIAQWYFGDALKSESRSCVPVCAPVNAVIRGTGGRTGCCTADLCNAQYNTSTRFVPYNRVLFCLLAILFSKIQL